MKLQITIEQKIHIENKIQELQQYSPIETPDDYINLGKQQQLKEILENAAVISTTPVGESTVQKIVNTLSSISDIEKIKMELVGKLATMIKALPQNAEINHLHNGAFSVKLSTIANSGGILSPEFYDFKFQYNAISEKLLESENPVGLIQKIILEKKLLMKKGGVMKINEQVIENLKTIL